MSGVDNLNGVAIPGSEEAFFQLLQSSSDVALANWALNYHYFLVHQAKLLPVAVSALPTNDFHSLVEVDEVLSEEYGAGNADQVRSSLFLRFCSALQIEPATLPMQRDQVLPPVIELLDAISSAYRSSELATTLGVYCFLKRSAALSYPLMREALRRLSFSDDDLRFFFVYGAQEAEYELEASRMAGQLIVTAKQQGQFAASFERVRGLWAGFWGALVPGDRLVKDRGGNSPSFDSKLMGTITEIVVEAFREVGEDVSVAPETDLLALGVDSLMLMTVVSRIRAATGVRIALEAIFADATVESLYRLVDAELSAASKVESPLAPITSATQVEAVLSPSEKRFWLLDSLQERAGAYNIFQAVKLSGRLNKNLLEAAVNSVVSRHDLLRTEYSSDAPSIKRVHSFAPVQLRNVDLRDGDSGPSSVALQDALNVERGTPFRFDAPPLLRATLYQTGSEEFVFAVCVHHVVCDAWSIALIVKQIAEYYRYASSEHRPPKLSSVPQYRAYVERELAGRTPERESTLRKFWKDQLSGDIAALDLPGARLKVEDPTQHALTCNLDLDGKVRQQLREYCQAHGASLSMLLLATLAGLIARLSQQEDVVICLPIAERFEAGAGDLVGCLLNTLPLRIDVSGNPSMSTLQARTTACTLAAYEHQDLPFEQILELVRADGRHTQSPLSQVFLNVTSAPSVDLNLPDVQAEELHLDSTVAKEPLAIYVKDSPAGLRLQFVWQEALYEEGRIQILAEQFRGLLLQSVQSPERPIGEHSLVTSASHLFLADPGLPLAEPREGTCVSMFETMAASQPKAVAISSAEGTYSYGELSQAVRRIANDLAYAEGVQAGDVVALYGRRSFGLIAAMLAVMSTRAVLLTIAMNTQGSRVKEMLDQAKATRLLVVSDAPLPSATLEALSGIKTLHITQNEGSIRGREDASPHDLLPQLVPEDPAYIFFTSGTTGKPKGILGQHRGLAHFLAWQRREFDIGPGDRAGQLTNLNFDVVMRDILTPLTSGATVCLPEDEEDLSADTVFPWLKQQGITYFHTVPTLARAWMLNKQAVCELPSLRYIFFAGEQLPGSLVAEARRRIRADLGVINLYGPTETTLTKSFFVVPFSADLPSNMPVGRALPNTQLLVLGPNGIRAGLGERGEVAIRTMAGTLGYLKEGQSSPPFVRNHFSDDSSPNQLLYMTGDIGFIGGNGVLHLSGRKDDQAKVNGIRVEPAEIRSAIESHEGVRQSAVVIFSDAFDRKRIAAYVVPRAQRLDVGALQGHLRNVLPRHMLPSVVIELQQLPYTSNGKLDRRNLPDPVLAMKDVRGSETSKPMSAIEVAISDTWKSVLQIEDVGREANFFDVGGSSLLLMSVRKELATKFNREIPLIDLYKAPTIAALAKQLSEEAPNGRAPGSANESSIGRKLPGTAAARLQRVRS